MNTSDECPSHQASNETNPTPTTHYVSVVPLEMNVVAYATESAPPVRSLVGASGVRNLVYVQLALALLLFVGFYSSWWNILVAVFVAITASIGLDGTTGVVSEKRRTNVMIYQRLNRIVVVIAIISLTFAVLVMVLWDHILEAMRARSAHEYSATLLYIFFGFEIFLHSMIGLVSFEAARRSKKLDQAMKEALSGSSNNTNAMAQPVV